MSWPAWIAVVITLLLSLIALVRSYSEDRGASREWRKMIEDTLRRYEAEFAKHNRHAEDVDRHWTPRERSDLTRQLDRIEELIKESMTQRAGQIRGSID